jgi:hypothetical protein
LSSFGHFLQLFPPWASPKQTEQSLEAGIASAVFAGRNETWGIYYTEIRKMRPQEISQGQKGG